MKFTQLSAGLVAVLAIGLAPAFAADLPSRKAAPPQMFSPVPVYSWQGFYLGASIGYGWESANNTFGTVVAAASPSGVIGGGYIGYNWLAGQSFVLGLEGDIEGSGIQQNRTVAALPVLGLGVGLALGNSINISNTFRASVRARAGVTMDRALLYVTGGMAYGQFAATMRWGNALSETWSNGRAGWTVGAGLDYALTNNWIARVEYRFTSYGNFSRVSPIFGGTITQRVNDNAIRVGVAYKFGGGYSAPVVARY